MTATVFEVGEIINPEDWGLRIQITAVDGLVAAGTRALEILEAVVVKNNEPTSYVGKFFPVGKTLRFTRCNPGHDSWRIASEERDMPWFILGSYEGRKRFEHYR